MVREWVWYGPVPAGFGCGCRGGCVCAGEPAATTSDRGEPEAGDITNPTGEPLESVSAEAKNTDPTTPENQARALERYKTGFLRWALESDKRKAEYGHTPMPQIKIPDDPYA